MSYTNLLMILEKKQYFFSLHILLNSQYTYIKKKINGMTFGIWHELLDLQTSLVHNVLDRQPIKFYHTELKYL